jgi:hypothetical protein
MADFLFFGFIGVAGTLRAGVGAGEFFRNDFDKTVFFFRAKQTAVDAAADGIQQLKPIFDGWILDGLPLVESFFAVMEDPGFADMLGVALERIALGGHAFPTDFGFRHGLLG